VNSFKIRATLIELLAGATLVDAEFAAELGLDAGVLPSALEAAPAGVDADEADEAVVVPLLLQAVSASSAALTAVPYTRLFGGRLLWNAIC